MTWDDLEETCESQCLSPSVTRGHNIDWFHVRRVEMETDTGGLSLHSKIKHVINQIHISSTSSNFLSFCFFADCLNWNSQLVPTTKKNNIQNVPTVFLVNIWSMWPRNVVSVYLPVGFPMPSCTSLTDHLTMIPITWHLLQLTKDSSCTVATKNPDIVSIVSYVLLHPHRGNLVLKTCGWSCLSHSLWLPVHNMSPLHLCANLTNQVFYSGNQVKQWTLIKTTVLWWTYFGKKPTKTPVDNVVNL